MVTPSDRLRVGWLNGFSLGGVLSEQRMLKGHLPRVIYHQVYSYTKITPSKRGLEEAGGRMRDISYGNRLYTNHVFAILCSILCYGNDV